MKIVKKIAIVLVVVLATIQFFPAKRNISEAAAAGNISNVYTTSDEVKKILAASCNDCHSNNTAYPWYSKIQPVGWWLASHVNEGKEKLNFDEFATYSPSRQYHKLEETEETVNEGEMPLSSYTLVHKDAVLTQQQKEALLNWSKSIRVQMEATYPKDSLISKRKT